MLLSGFIGKEVVVIEKFDGENISFYCDDLYVCSFDMCLYFLWIWVKVEWGCVVYDILFGW